MNELMHIILDLQRDVKRVSNAISPSGARRMVEKHNAANPSSPWTLHTDDVNNDGIPDVIIRNQRQEPMYVNGYTTKKSNYPLVYNYYNDHPTRQSRKNYPISAYKRDIFETQYVEDGDDYKAYGDVKYSVPKQFDGYNLDLYNIKNPKRMSSYTRYRKFIIEPCVDSVIQFLAENHNVYIPKRYKLQFVSSAAAALWEQALKEQWYDRFGATTKDAKAKVKKNMKEEIDNWVTQVIELVQRKEPQVMSTIGNGLAGVLIPLVKKFEQENPRISLKGLYDLDRANTQNSFID